MLGLSADELEQAVGFTEANIQRGQAIGLTQANIQQ